MTKPGRLPAQLVDFLRYTRQLMRQGTKAELFRILALIVFVAVLVGLALMVVYWDEFVR